MYFEGELGELRIKKSIEVLNKTDVALLVIDGVVGVTDFERELIPKIKEKKIPIIGILNKEDIHNLNKDEVDKIAKDLGIKIISMSAKNKNGKKELITSLITEDSIAISFAGVTVGATTLTHNEWTNPRASGGTGCAAGAPTTLTIQVLDAPSVDCVPDTVGGCDYHDANPTVNIPLAFDGAGPYEVYYKVIKNDFAGNPAVEQVYCDVIGSTSPDGTENLNLPVSWGAAANDELGVAPTLFGEYGMYTIYIEDVVDRFSNKSLVYVQGSVTQGAYTGDEGTPDAADGYYIVDFPAPTAQPIQHIENTYHND